jgi:hypothetical protein
MGIIKKLITLIVRANYAIGKNKIKIKSHGLYLKFYFRQSQQKK